MAPLDRHLWLGLLSTTARDGVRAGSRGRGKRNLWVVITYFVLILLAWIDSQL